MGESQLGFNPLQYPLSFVTPLDVRAVSWHEHIPFGMALVQMIGPRTLVELGVHTGDSYLAFCQAVAAAETGTACFGIDTWRGDAHAGFYDDAILRDLRGRHDLRYGSFSKLVQATFDEAAVSFEVGSIDMLHIDGFHTYEAVRHDFETWLPKVSSRGVILIHDTAVRERDFGVYRLWEEIATRWPSFAFEHGYGLGVLAVGPEVPESLRPLLSLRPDEQVAVRALYEALGNRVGAEVLCRDLKAIVAARDGSLVELGARLAAEQAARADLEARLGSARADLENSVREREAAVTEANHKLNELVAAFAAVTGSVSWKLGRALTAPLRLMLGRR